MLLLAAVPLAGPLALQAQQEADSAPPLRVFIECTAADVCQGGLPQDLSWVEWVSDSARADVHVRIEASGTPAELAAVAPHAAGISPAHYVLSFRSGGAVPARTDTLRHAAAPGDPAALRAGLMQAVQLGLVRYAAESSLGARLRIALAPAPAGAGRDDVPAVPVAAAAGAQPRAAASPRVPAEQRRWAASVDMGFSGSSGNSDFAALTSGVRVRHLQTNRFKLDWSASFRYGESGGSVAARHTQSKLDFDLGPSARVAPFISVSGERDPFRRLDLRARGGTGARFALYRADRGEAAVRAALLYTHERFRPEAEREPRSEGVWSFKFAGHRQLGESIRIETSSSYDPAVGDFGDYNAEVTSKLSTRISRRLALTVSHTFAYDATPLPGIEPTDQRYQTGLTLDF